MLISSKNRIFFRIFRNSCIYSAIIASLQSNQKEKYTIFACFLTKYNL